ncbi:MAG: DUF4159 domain-containing protein [Candidatus Riflebacteria bacterium]|nr:DUF4159 domain-containing protein [Candidatus Riflebacteria bacterium]
MSIPKRMAGPADPPGRWRRPGARPGLLGRPWGPGLVAMLVAMLVTLAGRGVARLAASTDVADRDARVARVAASASEPRDPPSPVPSRGREDGSADRTDGAGLPGAGAAAIGGEDGSVVQVANLIYARVKSSQCFSDHFLIQAERVSSIATSRRFHAVKLSSGELFSFPFVIMTGEGEFELPADERRNLRRYLEKGGFVLASAGCSSLQWDGSFRREISRVFPDQPLRELSIDHPVFHTVRDIDRVHVAHGTAQPFRVLVLGTRVALLYSADGLNDTKNATGCCCCGGNEIVNAEEININVLAYALSF